MQQTHRGTNAGFNKQFARKPTTKSSTTKLVGIWQKRIEKVQQEQLSKLRDKTKNSVQIENTPSQPPELQEVNLYVKSQEDVEFRLKEENFQKLAEFDFGYLSIYSQND